MRRPFPSNDSHIGQLLLNREIPLFLPVFISLSLSLSFLPPAECVSASDSAGEVTPSADNGNGRMALERKRKEKKEREKEVPFLFGLQTKGSESRFSH